MVFSFSLHAETKHRAAADFFFSDDTDGTETQKYLLGYERVFTEEQYFGVHAGVRSYHGEDAPVKDNNFDELKLVGRKNLSQKTYLQGSISFMDGDSWAPELYNATLVHTLNRKWKIDGYIDKEILDTASAIAKQYTIKTYGATADYTVNEIHAVAAGVYKQSIPDANSRTGSLLQYTYRPAWFEDGYFRLRAKQRNSDFDPIEYFSPDSLKQKHAIVGYESVIDQERNIIFKAELGQGRQIINGVSESAEEYILGLRGWIGNETYMDSYYGCTSDGGTSDYSYCYGRVVFNYLW